MFFYINQLNFNYIPLILMIISIILALYVILDNNPMYSILYLILLFVFISLYLYYNNLTIMSLLYLLVYIGAISILFLFILALLDIKLTELNLKSYNKDMNLIIITFLILYTYIFKFNTQIHQYINNDNIIMIFNNKWNNLQYYTELSNIGILLYTQYSIILIIISIILLLSIVGIIVLSIHKENE